MTPGRQRSFALMNVCVNPLLIPLLERYEATARVVREDNDVTVIAELEDPSR